MNNNYLKKHEENLASAELLIHNHCHYCSSIHCSYYSVFQYMLHFHKVRGTQIYRNRDRLDNLGSHGLIINATFAILQEVDIKRANHFDREIRRLKTSRITADYKEAQIDRTVSIVAYDMAKNLIHFLSELIQP